MQLPSSVKLELLLAFLGERATGLVDRINRRDSTVVDEVRDVIKKAEFFYLMQVPSQIEAKTKLGWIYLALGNFAEAMAGRSAAISLFIDAHQSLAQAYGTQSDFCAQLRKEYPELERLSGLAEVEFELIPGSEY